MTTTRPQIAIHDIETDEVIIRQMNDAELAQYEIDLSNMQAESAKLNAKISARESAIAKLAALGLTEDEAKAIIG